MAWLRILKDNNSTYVLFYKEPKFASMNIPFYQVDAFTHQPFKGNPAGVCLLDTPITDHLLRSIAAENSHLEIAFLLTTPDGYNLRWFSPRMEMPLCGHATLATAHILWELGLESREKTLQFQTSSGTLTATQQDGWIELDLPSRSSEQRSIPADLQTLFPHRKNIVYSVDRYIVELSSAGEVRGFIPTPFC